MEVLAAILAIDADSSPLEVHTVPSEPKQFTFAHAREEADKESVEKLIISGSIKESGQLCVCKGPHFLFLHLGQGTVVRNVPRHVAQFNRHSEG